MSHSITSVEDSYPEDEITLGQAVEEVFCNIDYMQEAFDDLKVEQLAHLTETLA